MDAVQASSKPIFIKHTGARALWDAKRLKTDEVIKACADKGGVIGGNTLRVLKEVWY